MRLNDLLGPLFPLLMPASAEPNTTRNSAAASPPADEDTAANLRFVSSVWALAQDTMTRTAPGGRLQTPVHLDAAPVAANAPFAIYARRTADAGASQTLQRLYVRPSFFNFPLPVQLGLVWGMGAAARDERYLSDQHLVQVRTYGQNAHGFRYPSSPTADISRVFGQQIAQQVEQAWDSHLRDNNLEVPRYPEDAPPARVGAAGDDAPPSYGQAVRRALTGF